MSLAEGSTTSLRSSCTCEKLFQAPADPDVIQRLGSLWVLCADVGEGAGRDQVMELLLPQYVVVACVWGLVKISQDDHVFFS